MAPRPFDIDRVGPYRILRALEWEGATSFVAREEGPIGFRRDVILKVVAEGDPSHAEAARDFAQEATLGSRLNHPNIVRTHGFFAQAGRLMLVIEHVDGITLAELLASLRTRQERLTDPAALYVGVAVLEALAHAHAQMDAAGVEAPVVHGRLSPSHVVLGKDGTVKIAGFCAVARDPVSASGEPTAVAAAGAAWAQSEKADVRAAGLILWEMLTGRDASAGLEPLSDVRGDLPRELSAAVGAALDVANAKRTIGCAEVASWIKKVARFAGGRDELRARVALLAPAAEPEQATLDTNGESGRVPLHGWSVRLAPIANKVLAVGTGFPRLDAAVRGHLVALRATAAARWPKLDAVLRRHHRASLGVGVGVVIVLTLLTMVRIFSAPRTVASLEAQRRVVPAAPSPPTHRSGPAANIAARPIEAVATRPGQTDPVATAPAPAVSSPPEKAEPTPPPADKAVPGAAPNSTPKPPKGFGFLTVHSSLGYAYVYVQLFRYGHVEHRLTVRCGKRFLSLGTPKPTGGEPTWYAPSRTVDVPCGGSLEVTMMPKWIP